MKSDASHVQDPPEIAPTVVPPSQTLAPPDVLAGQLEDQRACMNQVNAIDESYQDRQAAWKLLFACVEKGKVTSFDILFEDRWRPFLVKLDATSQAKVASRLIASRGGKVAGDIPLAQKQGIKLFGLAEVIEQPSMHKGSLVLVRAAVTDQSEQGAGVAFELDETTDRAIDYYESSYDSTGQGVDRLGRKLAQDRYGRKYARARSNSVTMPTGRTLTAKAPTPIRGIEVEGEYLFLVRFEKRRPPEDDLDDSQHAVVTVLGAFKPSVDALPLGR